MTIDLDSLPTDVLERVRMLEGILIEAATGGSDDTEIYEYLRRELMANSSLRKRLPTFVRTYRNLGSFWPFIKEEDGTYAGRRKIIGEAFTPIFDYLEGFSASPMDEAATNQLLSFDPVGVHDVWMKALERRESDPEGAITIARTLLETVTKRILDEHGTTYTDKEDLPKLYNMAAKNLNLAPNQHSQEAIKSILGGAMTMVNGLGTLRNKLSDSHGRGGKKPVKPSERHANLAVNTAGAIATFLVETHLARIKP